MLKVFTTNKEGKIELTKDELKSLLDESYWDGFKANQSPYTYHSPFWTPYTWSSTTVSNMCELKPNDNSIASDHRTTINAANIVSAPNSACEAH